MCQCEKPRDSFIIVAAFAVSNTSIVAEPEEPGEADKNVIIAAASAGGVALIALCVGAFLVWRRRYRQRIQQRYEDSQWVAPERREMPVIQDDWLWGASQGVAQAQLDGEDALQGVDRKSVSPPSLSSLRLGRKGDTRNAGSTRPDLSKFSKRLDSGDAGGVKLVGVEVEEEEVCPELDADVAVDEQVQVLGQATGCVDEAVEEDAQAVLDRRIQELAERVEAAVGDEEDRSAGKEGSSSTFSVRLSSSELGSALRNTSLPDTDDLSSMTSGLV